MNTTTTNALPADLNPETCSVCPETGLFQVRAIVSWYDDTDDWMVPAGYVMYDRATIPGGGEVDPYLSHDERTVLVRFGTERQVLVASAAAAGCTFVPAC